MQKHATEINLANLLTRVINLPTTVDAGNVNMAYDQGYDTEKITDPYVRSALAEIECITGGRAKQIMVNTLKANRGSPIHTDTLARPYHRYHLPLQTNKNAVWWDDDNGFYHMELGYWHGPVPYYKDHQVINSGDTDRIHLIIDLEIS